MYKFEMEMSKYAMEVLAKGKNMDKVMAFVELCFADLGSPRDSKQLTIVGEELASNIFNYAYDGAPGIFAITIYLCPEQNKVTMEFRDAGKPFNPLKKSEPDLEEDISERNIGGLGITLSKKLTDNQTYRYENGQNVFQVEKYITPRKGEKLEDRGE